MQADSRKGRTVLPRKVLQKDQACISLPYPWILIQNDSGHTVVAFTLLWWNNYTERESTNISGWGSSHWSVIWRNENPCLSKYTIPMHKGKYFCVEIHINKGGCFCSPGVWKEQDSRVPASSTQIKSLLSEISMKYVVGKLFCWSQFMQFCWLLCTTSHWRPCLEASRHERLHEGEATLYGVQKGEGLCLSLSPRQKAQSVFKVATK